MAARIDRLNATIDTQAKTIDVAVKDKIAATGQIATLTGAVAVHVEKEASRIRPLPPSPTSQRRGTKNTWSQPPRSSTGFVPPQVPSSPASSSGTTTLPQGPPRRGSCGPRCHADQACHDHAGPHRFDQVHQPTRTMSTFFWVSSLEPSAPPQAGSGTRKSLPRPKPNCSPPRRPPKPRLSAWRTSFPSHLIQSLTLNPPPDRNPTPMPPEAGSERLNRAVEQLFALARDSANKQSDFIKEWAVKHGSCVSTSPRLRRDFQRRQRLPARIPACACHWSLAWTFSGPTLTTSRLSLPRPRAAGAECSPWRAQSAARRDFAAIATWVRKP